MQIYQPAEDSYLMEDAIKKVVSKNMKVLEMGIGSGILLGKLRALGIKKKNIYGIDVNPYAVNYCKKRGFKCITSYLFSKVPEKKFDLIIFNPPYLPRDSREPKDSQIATTGGRKGGELINNFLKQAAKYLNKDGKILLLTSSLTKGIEWKNWRKKKVAETKIFMEELYVWEAGYK